MMRWFWGFFVEEFLFWQVRGVGWKRASLWGFNEEQLGPVTRRYSSKMRFFCWMIFLFKFLGLRRPGFQHDIQLQAATRNLRSSAFLRKGVYSPGMSRVKYSKFKAAAIESHHLCKAFTFRLSYWTWNRPRWQPNGSSRHRPGGLIIFFGGTDNWSGSLTSYFFWRRGIQIKSTNCWMWSSCTSICSSTPKCGFFGGQEAQRESYLAAWPAKHDETTERC